MAKYRKNKSKYEEEAVIVKNAKVNKIDYINQLVNNKYKSVFYCPSYVEPEGRMCIYWGRLSSIEVGDEIEMKGRYIDGTFLVWSMKVLRHNADRGV